MNDLEDSHKRDLDEDDASKTENAKSRIPKYDTGRFTDEDVVGAFIEKQLKHGATEDEIISLLRGPKMAGRNKLIDRIRMDKAHLGVNNPEHSFEAEQNTHYPDPSALLLEKSIQPVRVNETIRSWFRLFADRYKPVSFELNLGLEDTASVRINPRWLGFALRHLVENAGKAMTQPLLADPRIIVETRQVGNDVEISVADNGPGIPKSIRDTHFLFQQKPITEPVAGRGLLIINFLAQTHGGHFRFDETGATGAKFIISLPLAINTSKLVTLAQTTGSDLSLTPKYLKTIIGPYLEAISEIQFVIDEIQNRQSEETTIKSIEQHSPISVSLDGVSGAIDLVQQNVVPWRRKHAEKISLLLEQEKQVDIESKRADILVKRANAAKDRAEATKLAAEAAKQLEEVEKLRLENERLRFELHKARIHLALEILVQVAPTMPEADRIAYVTKLLPPLDIVIFSELEITNQE
jgi:hypothetical protein